LKALIITYYWPPAGGSGVQRWLYFVKYLRDFGVEPIIFTVKHPNYPIEDNSLTTLIPKDVETIKQEIWEPNNILGKKKKKSAGFLSQNPSFTQRIMQYIRANYFIPDARKFWIKPSVKRILNYVENNKIDWIITTGPPHSVHLIGKEIKNITGINWLADFRDPWTDIDYFHQLPLTKNSLQKHLNLERLVLKAADIVTVVGLSMAKKYRQINANTYVITNGYDGKPAERNTLQSKKFLLTHLGLLNADRNPHIFWEVIQELTLENSGFSNNLKIKLVGKIADEVKRSIKKHQLEKYIDIIEYLPHNEVFKELISSQVLLLFINDVPSAKGILTGKVFEYLRARRPILTIGPKDGDLKPIFKETKSGVIVDFKDKIALKKQVLLYFNQYKTNQLSVKSENIESYQRKNLTKQLVKLLKNN
jgi:glycosyltransferase involved in cell wall biosynthesis